MSTGPRRPLDAVGLRRVVVEHCGFDPGEFALRARLDALGLDGFSRLSLVAALEAAHGIEFPADLITALETVDDLIHYTNIKVGQLP